MSRYVDLDFALKRIKETIDSLPVVLCDKCKHTLLDKNFTSTFPIADYVSVIRCKDCVWFETDGNCNWCNNWDGCGTDENGFCHDAERKRGS